MTEKRYHNPDEVLGDAQSHNNVQLPNGVEWHAPNRGDVVDICTEFYNRVEPSSNWDRGDGGYGGGEGFPVTIEPWSSAEPIIDTDDLPNGVTESDVETVLTNMKNDGLL